MSDAYPAWQPKYDSKILEITREAYKDMFGKGDKDNDDDKNKNAPKGSKSPIDLVAECELK